MQHDRYPSWKCLAAWAALGLAFGLILAWAQPARSEEPMAMAAFLVSDDNPADSGWVVIAPKESGQVFDPAAPAPVPIAPLRVASQLCDGSGTVTAYVAKNFRGFSWTRYACVPESEIGAFLSRHKPLAHNYAESR